MRSIEWPWSKCEHRLVLAREDEGWRLRTGRASLVHTSCGQTRDERFISHRACNNAPTEPSSTINAMEVVTCGPAGFRRFHHGLIAHGRHNRTDSRHGRVEDAPRRGAQQTPPSRHAARAHSPAYVARLTIPVDTCPSDGTQAPRPLHPEPTLFGGLARQVFDDGDSLHELGR